MTYINLTKENKMTKENFTISADVRHEDYSVDIECNNEQNEYFLSFGLTNYTTDDFDRQAELNEHNFNVIDNLSPEQKREFRLMCKEIIRSERVGESVERITFCTNCALETYKY